MKINWLDESPLTYEEAMELLNRTHSRRLEMEEKNKWDAFVNDFTFWTFLHDTYCYMREEVNKEVDIDLNYFYPKIKELNDWEEFVDRSNRPAKDVLSKPIRDLLNLGEKENIWEIVEDWWKTLFEMLYLY